MPAMLPDGLKIAVLTPISRPALSSSGPPELPGLMAASVWMTSLMGRFVTDWISRPRALMTPVVSVWSRPNGLPMAKTFWPTCRSAELPTAMGQQLAPGGVDVQHGEVLVGVGADQRRSVGGVVGQRDTSAQAWRVLDDVEVGDDVAVLVPDEARAGALRHLLDVEVPEIALHRQRGDVDDGGLGLLVDLDVGFLDLGQVAARRDGAGCRRCCACDS